MYIPIIFGTDPISSPRIKGIASYVFDKVGRTGLKTEIIDAREADSTGGVANQETKKLIKSISLADGMIIVSPKSVKSLAGGLSMLPACFIVGSLKAFK